MSTVDSKKIILELLENEGSFQGDPIPYKVCRYFHTMARKWTHSICYKRADWLSLNVSPYVSSIEVLFEDDKLTAKGVNYRNMLRDE